MGLTAPNQELQQHGSRMMAAPRVTQIPFPGNSGDTPTGAMQFRDDWPGLFVRGDDAIGVFFAIRSLQERLADNPDVEVASALLRLSRYAEIIEQDVIVRRSDRTLSSYDPKMLANVSWRGSEVAATLNELDAILDRITQEVPGEMPQGGTMVIVLR
jgi:hypothetical protein